MNREETEAAHLAECGICAFRPRTYLGCHYGLSDGDPCPHPPVEAFEDMIIPEEARVCEWHLYALAAPIARQLQEAELAASFTARRPTPGAA